MWGSIRKSIVILSMSLLLLNSGHSVWSQARINESSQIRNLDSITSDQLLLRDFQSPVSPTLPSTGLDNESGGFQLDFPSSVMRESISRIQRERSKRLESYKRLLNQGGGNDGLSAGDAVRFRNMLDDLIVNIQRVVPPDDTLPEQIDKLRSGNATDLLAMLETSEVIASAKKCTAAATQLKSLVPVAGSASLNRLANKCGFDSGTGKVLDLAKINACIVIYETYDEACLGGPEMVPSHTLLSGIFSANQPGKDRFIQCSFTRVANRYAITARHCLLPLANGNAITKAVSRGNANFGGNSIDEIIAAYYAPDYERITTEELRADPNQLKGIPADDIALVEFNPTTSNEAAAIFFPRLAVVSEPAPLRLTGFVPAAARLVGLNAMKDGAPLVNDENLIASGVWVEGLRSEASKHCFSTFHSDAEDAKNIATHSCQSGGKTSGGAIRHRGMIGEPIIGVHISADAVIGANNAAMLRSNDHSKIIAIIQQTE